MMSIRKAGFEARRRASRSPESEHLDWEAVGPENVREL